MNNYRKIFCAFLVLIINSSSLSADESVCKDVLTTKAFNTQSYSEITNILHKQYDYLCNYEFESKSQAKSAASSSGLSIGYAGFTLGASDARKNINNKWSFKESNYCRNFAE